MSYLLSSVLTYGTAAAMLAALNGSRPGEAQHPSQIPAALSASDTAAIVDQGPAAEAMTVIDFWREAGGFIAGNQKLFAEIVWPHFWAIQILLGVLILMYCTMHELVRVIGRDKVLEIFFGTPPRARSS